MYGFNPYQQPMASYPQRFQGYPQQQVYQYQNIKGRIVTGVEEARAAQVDLDGTPSYFPSMGEGKIYVKYIGMDGLPVFQTFVVEAQKANIVAAPNNGGITLESLSQRVQNLEGILANINGGMNNAQSNANDTNVAV